MKSKMRFLASLGIGFAVAMIAMGIAIYFGYVEAYHTETNLLTVKLLGLPIYELTKTGEKYVGEPAGIYMGCFCGICMILSAIVAEIIRRVRHK